MLLSSTLKSLSLLLLALLLNACGGGGGGSGNRDVFTADPAVVDTSGPNSFLLFPNPLVQSDGSFQTDTIAYAQAYYAAIDPTNQKDTLAKWMSANGFDSGTGTQVSVVFGDQRDLGYGRRMTARQNVDGSIAVMVENYVVEPAANYTYSTLNLDAAVVQDRRWHIATNAIEFSVSPTSGIVRFVKFFTFDPTTGARELTANMDGRGEKAMPSPCISCHGGRADPLTPAVNGSPLFPFVANMPSMARGDVQARMQPLEVDTFDFNSAFGLTRASQEAAFKTINKFILCSYPEPNPRSGSPEDTCRVLAGTNEWQGTAAVVIKTAYGGNGLPNATFNDTYLPNSWLVAGQTSLYQGSVVPACRNCHILRGTINQQDIDFDTFGRFQGFADRIKIHSFDRGNMPLAFLIYDRFFNTSMAASVADFLLGEGLNVRVNGAVLRPGGPIADPDPDRTVGLGSTTLSGLRSLFSTAYQWSFVSNPGGATLTNPNSAQPTFNATVNGTYVLQLISSRGSLQSTPVQLRLVVNNALSPAPAAIRFSTNIQPTLLANCNVCHVSGGNAPIIFDNIDRNGDGVIGDATDDLFLYTELRGRINFTEIAASPLLRKPSGAHHGGGQRNGFDTSLAPGQLVGGQNNLGRGNYDLFLNWILNGAPQ